MTKRHYIQPQTEIVLPFLDPIQETVPVYWSETNNRDIEANGFFFDDQEDSDNDEFFDD